MVWLAIDEDGLERIHSLKPIRVKDELGCAIWDDGLKSINLPKGSIKKLIGRELKWSDEPIEFK